MSGLSGRRILLGVSGGIAAYKAVALTSRLVQEGAIVDVIMTGAAQRFVTPLSFAALTQRHVHTSLWEAPESIPHIALVRAAELLAIVPASADVIAKLAYGLADDLLTSAALAARIPLLVAPAMNSAMYEHGATVANLRTLRARGVTIVEPGEGFLAEREHGVGRLADEDALLHAIERALAQRTQLSGQRVVITAGPTREAIDPVRFLSNASTGTMGIELAHEALARGASVDLILGPTLVDPPASARVTRVTSAQEMYDATLAVANGADYAIAAAAVADWRPAQTHEQKIKKDGGPAAIELVPTPDILATLGERKNGTFLVGFAAETERLEANAREKLTRKHLDAIAVNDVSDEEVGFGTGDNEIVILWNGGREALGRGPKRDLATRMWDRLIALKARR
ncbi:MAG TPA: bifunctional phosphopantothenoylcysteine decarboxylase/phosphopantothenate--cysteine ligase CoaBC [Candidatus Binatia bacterium]|nr:bifunctional phosphopantothenoylcysteine decarboxylase/phosphopantothenate--cysteine ligase CoaBC [Candidatus Binatia bacterium]